MYSLTRHPAKTLFAAGIICLVGTTTPTPTLADAIDGEWCHAGLSMKIDGPTVVTPGGNKLQGTYSRHDFQYIVPPGETGSGAKVDATLLSDDEMQVTSSTTPKPVTWRRCQVTS